MGYKELSIKRSYETDSYNSILNQFLIPVLKCSSEYKRAVGYFNSRALLNMAEGIQGLIDNGGKIKLIVSPRLEPEDILAIKAGCELDDVIKRSIKKEIEEGEIALRDINNLEILENLVASGILEIKVAFTKTYGIYHEKIGIMKSIDTEQIGFTGSLNETLAAQEVNFESIDVFRSWVGTENDRIVEKEIKFERIWNDKEEKLIIRNFPKVIAEDLIGRDIKREILYKEVFPIIENIKRTGPMKPDFSPHFIFEFRDYQLEAIAKWKANNFKGIFSMGTGTGKTLTSIGALLSLWNEMNESLFLLILCPYTHLVEQWEEDLIKSNVYPIKAYSAYKWKESSKDAIRRLNYGISDFECIICTNGTYISGEMQKTLSKVKCKRMIIVDEAHNFGSGEIRKFHDESFDFRLALSATYKRYFDDEGTKSLLNYFNKIVYELGLEKAIEMGALTKYYYHPVVTTLTEDEYEEYKKITKKIGKMYASSNDEDNNGLTTLLIKRSRILNLAENKLVEFKRLISERSDTYDNLVYCAAGKMKSGERQIDEVTKILGNDLDMRTHKFTAEENSEIRSMIIKDFEDRKIQAIVAIKCLDEGVNIPSIETAYILASSGNEKEFIQRRGRVLRKSKGKQFANIYDFIVLPRASEMTGNISEDEIRIDKSIINKELGRMREFVDLSLNSYEGNKLISNIEREYKIIY
jgi:superfamily II DNA or RNA helicase